MSSKSSAIAPLRRLKACRKNKFALRTIFGKTTNICGSYEPACSEGELTVGNCQRTSRCAGADENQFITETQRAQRNLKGDLGARRFSQFLLCRAGRWLLERIGIGRAIHF